MTRKIFTALFISLVCLSATYSSIVEGIQRFEKGQYAEARAILLPLAAQGPEAATACRHIALSYYEEGEFEKAIEWLDRAIEKEPRDSTHYMWLGRSYIERASTASIFKKPSLASSARKAWEKAVELQPSNLEARHDLVIFYMRAPRLMGGGRDRAVEQAEVIKKQDASRGHRAWATIYNEDGDSDAERKELESVVRLNPDSVGAYYSLGFLEQSQEDYDAALLTFRRIRERFPAEMAAVYQIGRIGALSGRHLEEAVEAFKLYLQHEPGPQSPSLADAHWRLGMVHRHQGKLDAARKSLEAAIALEPKHKQARQELKSLR